MIGLFHSLFELRNHPNYKKQGWKEVIKHAQYVSDQNNTKLHPLVVIHFVVLVFFKFNGKLANDIDVLYVEPQ